MIGVGSDAVVSWIGTGLSGGISPPPSSAGLRLSGSDGIGGHIQATDAGADVTITTPQRHAGTYAVSQADLNSGGPVWLVPPSVAADGPGAWIVDDPGILLAPSDDRPIIVMQWLRDGDVDGSGTRHSITAEGQYSRIELRARAVNDASGPSGRIATALAQASTFHVARRFHGTRLIANLEEVGPTLPDLTIGLWHRSSDGSRLDALRTFYWDEHGASQVGLQMIVHSSRLQFLYFAPDGDGTIARNSATLHFDRNIVAGTDVLVVAQIEGATGTMEVHASIDGGPRQSTSRTSSYSGGVHFDQHSMDLMINSDVRAEFRRLALWPTAPDLSDPALWVELMQQDGGMRSHDRANTVLGVPLYDVRLDGQTLDDLTAGTNPGTGGDFHFTEQSPFQEFADVD
ncbi:hypothetical protein [Jannaschia sp. LMIT008]|uniref:hypothetical protein n=1 Tax=Jannaschia maritima TaxID=3032585 RepID=UPI002810FFDA|nr:hypothetical protein [Jannaschia sp. LMIT008]